jgi:hypothetical protein
MSTSNLSKKEIEQLIISFQEVKQQIKEFEEQESLLKKEIIQIMKDYEVSELKGKTCRVQLRSMSRQTISKKDVPSDIWDRYSKTSQSDALYCLLPSKNKD